jgi:hypothetical protein
MQVSPAVDLVARQVLEPRPRGVTEVKRHVFDDDEVVYRSSLVACCRLSSSHTLGLVSPSYLGTLVLTVKFGQPSHEFTFGVGMSFISYPLILTPLV